MAECLLDTLPARTGGTLCWRHHDDVVRMLDPNNHGDRDADHPASVIVMLRMLNPGPSSGTTGRRAPGYGSVPAADIHKLIMLDDRSQVGSPRVWFGPDAFGREDLNQPYCEDEEVPRSIKKALISLAEAVAERLGVTVPPDDSQPPLTLTDTEHLEGPRLHDDRYFTAETGGTARLAGPRDAYGRYYAGWTAHKAAGWLHSIALTLTSFSDADWIYDDLLELTDQLRPAVGDPHLAPAGKCIEMIRDRASRTYRDCNCPLYLPPPERDPVDQTPEQAHRAVIVTCRRCRRKYTWLDLIRLRQAQAS